jgi:hypothetical protein
MSDPTAKAIRSVALLLASTGDATCDYQLPDGTIIVIKAATTLNPGEKLPAQPKPCINPQPFPIYFQTVSEGGGKSMRVLNPGAPRQDCTHGHLVATNLITPR